MEKGLRKYLLALLLSLLPMLLQAQGSIYTRSARLADFPQKTTKIVLSGEPTLDAVLKQEITSRWRISPYEFCTEKDYSALRTGTRYYFLHFKVDDEFTWMHLSKGGPSEGNPLKTAMEVVSIPVSSADDPTPEELVFLPAYIDIVQDYLLKAMVSDKVSYRDLRGIVSKKKKGKYICNDEELGRQLFMYEAPNYIVPVIVWGSQNGRHRHYYRMRISTGDHLLYEYRRKRIKI